MGGCESRQACNKAARSDKHATPPCLPSQACVKACKRFPACNKKKNTQRPSPAAGRRAQNACKGGGSGSSGHAAARRAGAGGGGEEERGIANNNQMQNPRSAGTARTAAAAAGGRERGCGRARPPGAACTGRRGPRPAGGTYFADATLEQGLGREDPLPDGRKLHVYSAAGSRKAAASAAQTIILRPLTSALPPAPPRTPPHLLLPEPGGIFRPHRIGPAGAPPRPPRSLRLPATCSASQAGGEERGRRDGAGAAAEGPGPLRRRGAARPAAGARCGRQGGAPRVSAARLERLPSSPKGRAPRTAHAALPGAPRSPRSRALPTGAGMAPSRVAVGGRTPARLCTAGRSAPSPAHGSCVGRQGPSEPVPAPATGFRFSALAPSPPHAHPPTHPPTPRQARGRAVWRAPCLQ